MLLINRFVRESIVIGGKTILSVVDIDPVIGTVYLEIDENFKEMVVGTNMSVSDSQIFLIKIINTVKYGTDELINMVTFGFTGSERILRKELLD